MGVDFVSTFGEKLRRLREEKGETQQDIAKMLKVSRTSISKYESDDREPDIETIKALSKHFNVSVDFIFDLRNANSYSPRGKESLVADRSMPFKDENYYNINPDEIRQLMDDKMFIRLVKKIKDNKLDISLIETLIDNFLMLR